MTLLYAQRSFSTELLYQTYGKAQMARQLEALSKSEFMEINHMTVSKTRCTSVATYNECRGGVRDGKKGYARGYLYRRIFRRCN